MPARHKDADNQRVADTRHFGHAQHGAQPNRLLRRKGRQRYPLQDKNHQRHDRIKGERHSPAEQIADKGAGGHAGHRTDRHASGDQRNRPRTLLFRHQTPPGGDGKRPESPDTDAENNASDQQNVKRVRHHRNAVGEDHRGRQQKQEPATIHTFGKQHNQRSRNRRNQPRQHYRQPGMAFGHAQRTGDRRKQADRQKFSVNQHECAAGERKYRQPSAESRSLWPGVQRCALSHYYYP